MRFAGWFAGLFVVACWASAAADDLHPPVDPVPFGDLRWLAPGSDKTPFLPRPARAETMTRGAEAQLGELLFRSPWVMGGMARRLGLSCDTCHPNGHRNARFFFPGVSGKPGTFDPTNAVFNPAKDDGKFAPLDIPSLRGIARRGGPFGTTVQETSLARFMRHVIVDEFQGAEPAPRLLAALSAYLEVIGRTDATDVPALLEDDVDSVARGVRLIEPLIEVGENAFADLALLSLRSELGRIHERFPQDGLETERDILEGMAAALRDIGEGLAAGRVDSVRESLRAWLVAYEDFDRAWLLAAEPKTLYNSAERESSPKRVKP